MAEEEFHGILGLFLHANLNQCFGKVFASLVSFGSSSPTISNCTLKGPGDSGKARTSYTQDMTSELQVATLCVLGSFPQPSMKSYTPSIPVGSFYKELPLYPQLKLLRAGPWPGLCLEFLHEMERTFNSRFSPAYTSFLDSSPLLFLPITSLAFSLVSVPPAHCGPHTVLHNRGPWCICRLLAQPFANIPQRVEHLKLLPNVCDKTLHTRVFRINKLTRYI